MNKATIVALTMLGYFLTGVGGLIGMYCSDQKMDLLIDEKLDEREKRRENEER